MVQKGLRDPETVRRLMNSAKGAVEARTVKEQLANIGYTFTMSLYGVLTNKASGRSEYRRMEILSQKLLDATDVELVYRWLQKLHPIKTYTIYIYRHEGNLLKEVFSTW